MFRKLLENKFLNNEPIALYLERFTKIWENLKAFDKKVFSEIIPTFILLNGLSEDYEAFILDIFSEKELPLFKRCKNKISTGGL